MKIKQIAIGNYQTENNIFLAPMAGYTDYAFRHLILKLGAGLTYTELASAKGIVYKGQGTNDLLYSGKDIDKTVAQIFGSELEYMTRACESEELKDFKIIDINMGCPVPKVYKNGEGSFLLTNIYKAEKVIKACVKSGKIITVKIRTGLKHGDDIASEYSIMAEQAGAKLITIHGRCREDYYSGEIDFNAIEKAKSKVQIPVIANGGIFTKSDAENIINRTGADGIMLARGAISNPFLFSELLGKDIKKDIKDFMLKHLKLFSEVKGERACIEFRKFVPYYLKGVANIKETKLKLQQATSVNELIDIIENEL